MKRIILWIFKFCRDGIDFTVFLLELLVKHSFSNPVREKFSGTLAVLANGPSLREVLPRLTDGEFKDADFMVMNFFALDDMFFKIKPKHYCLADPIFFADSYERERAKALYDIFRNRVDWKMHLYIPRSKYRQFIGFGGGVSENISVVCMNCIAYAGYEPFRRFFYHKGLSMPEPKTVAILALYAAILAGYSKILLYGADHTYTRSLFVNERNELCLTTSHFYEKESVRTWKEAHHSDQSMSSILKYFTCIFEAHGELRKMADRLHVKIINRTEGSFIDAYERTERQMIEVCG
ncbi:MAG: hypothetical protein LBR08_06940 [Bacteroidales bacterium]|jgi:hypothetical protein|nr:hypothetical protein [Bacteroidales bacterium]